MAYDEDLANRLRELVGAEPSVSEQKMFGGLAFLIGWLRVAPEHIRTKRDLARWTERGVSYARSLPAKSAKRAKAAKR